ncbi:lysylphosphatidylglycerol synthase transmembrane domain-containing protein [Ulvibacterium sp.]|uniref:lysylphosphatidylglycerol synthase transmembrane domain-containing protein n=1 Tax=Ulvibacterium sp. TaxID=2665914 RepID=UPI00261C9C3C|nr:lysylphosphatidylglycerol synthase transmembrane domain-containing protein [Ulvibacterium sp.]
MLKIVISFALIYFVITKIDFQEVLTILKKTQLFYLFPALVFFVLSKVFAALRLNLYFHEINIPLSQKSNLQLYLLGMFYNLFLPGGIGGDAYKGYLIKKNFEVGTKRVVSVLVLDRLSGLLLLFVYACILALLLDAQALVQIQWLFLLAILGSISVFWWINKRFFGYVLPAFWKSFGLSALVQLAQLISVYFILKAVYLSTGLVSYLFIFLISSIVAVLPLTIGGIGSREVTFFYGATVLSLDENISVSISMVFFLITALVSLLGVAYHFKRPQLKTARD